MRVRQSISKAMREKAMMRSGEVGRCERGRGYRRIEVEDKEVGACERLCD